MIYLTRTTEFIRQGIAEGLHLGAQVFVARNGETLFDEGVGEAQELFGGVPQEGARLGSEDAPVTVQVFGDEQSSLCREGFLTTIPELTEKYARPGSAKFLYRHYSNSENEIEYGFYGTEAAAEQGYGWQYAFLFYTNQEEADRFGVTEEENRRAGLRENFLDSVAGGETAGRLGSGIFGFGRFSGGGCLGPPNGCLTPSGGAAGAKAAMPAQPSASKKRKRKTVRGKKHEENMSKTDLTKRHKAVSAGSLM